MRTFASNGRKPPRKLDADQWSARAVMLGALILAVVLTGCGGQDHSSGSGGNSSAQSTAAQSSPHPVAPKPDGQANKRSSSGSGAETEGAGGGASAFRVTGGENSIPDFGREAHPSEQKQAAAALAAFLHAGVKHAWSKVCGYLTRPLRRQMEKFAKGSKGAAAGCGPVVAALMATYAAHSGAATPTADIAALRVEGDTAFALFYGQDASKYVMPMRNEGGAWKMSQLAPLPYPLTATSSGA